MSNQGKYATPNGFLRMCIDCKHSQMYQAANCRNIWFFCNHHKVNIHYNETCENYDPDPVRDKLIKPVKDFERAFQQPGKAGIP